MPSAYLNDPTITCRASVGVSSEFSGTATVSASAFCNHTAEYAGPTVQTAVRLRRLELVFFGFADILRTKRPVIVLIAIQRGTVLLAVGITTLVGIVAALDSL